LVECIDGFEYGTQFPFFTDPGNCFVVDMELRREDIASHIDEDIGSISKRRGTSVPGQTLNLKIESAAVNACAMIKG